MNKLLIIMIFSLINFPISTYSLPIEISQNKTCELCENIVEVIAKDATHFNSTITDIIEIIKNVCENVKGPSGMECLFILKNIEEIMNWILSGLSPNKVCELLDFCNSTIVESSGCF